MIVLNPTTAYNLVLGTNATSAFLTVTAATIQNLYWDGSAGRVWNNAANWSGDITGGGVGAVPDAVDNVYFSINGGGAGFTSTTLGQNIRVGSLNFNSNAATAVGIGGANTLTINSALNVDAGSGAHEISAPVIFGANQIWTINSSNPFKVSGNIDDGNNFFGLTKRGTGELILSGTNTFNAPVVVEAGVLPVTHMTSLFLTPCSPVPHP